MRAREIKDLCVAREALSRISGFAASDAASQIDTLISKLLHEATEELNPTKPATPTRYSIDDEIPF